MERNIIMTAVQITGPNGLSQIDRLSENYEIDSEIHLEGLRAEIENHVIFHNGYFGKLNDSLFTKETYSLHRANFFYRTELTVKAIAHVCARAADCDDELTLILFSHILNEEC